MAGVGRTDRTVLACAAVASIAAGMVHATAAGNHAGDTTLVRLFALAAAAQAAWGVIALLRPTRSVAWTGVALNSVFVGTWLLSRTTGLPLVDSLHDVEPVGTQDVLAAALGAAAVAGALLSVVQPVRRTSLETGWVVASIIAVTFVAVPAMAAQHTHDEGTAHVHGDTAVAAASDEHAAHEHATVSSGSAGTVTSAAGHHHDIPARLNHDPTDDQLKAAATLIANTKADTLQYADVSVAVANGYRSIGDQFTGVEHYVNRDYMADTDVLDPLKPESLVYRVNPDGTREFITVMYILPTGSTMDDVPDIAGNLTLWHDHDNLCFDPATSRLSGIFVNGVCRPGGVHVQTAPMLHVWVTPNPCGPFAGTDPSNMTGSCVTDSGLGV
ncbi:MAG TPA: hypothetical protein VK461_13985 [Acidimicrobiales bacterium]|nr:hypothetical protein [Acidimicrobiales bacterium]